MLELAEQLKDEQSLLVFGRGYNYATALEAALKVGSWATCYPNRRPVSYRRPVSMTCRCLTLAMICCASAAPLCFQDDIIVLAGGKSWFNPGNG